MKLNFLLLIDNGQNYSDSNPGIAIADYADCLAWQTERNEQFWDIVREHFEEHKRMSFRVDVTPDTTIKYLEKQIADRIGFEWKAFYETKTWRCCLLTDGYLVRIDDPLLCIADISKYITVNDELNICFVFSNQAGDIWTDDGLRYYMPSRESGSHNKPHIHVDYRHESHASICIGDGSLLSGSMPSKALREARKKIFENQEFLLRYWNEKTDGLSVDINSYLGAKPVVNR